MDFANFWYSSGSASQGGGDPGDPIQYSLRLDGDNYLIRDNLPGDGLSWTLSCWIKTAQIRVPDIRKGTFWCVGNPGGFSENKLYIDNNESFDNFQYNGSSYAQRIRPDGKVRDSNSWYHLCLVRDAASSTPADRNRLYINGVRITSTMCTNYSDLSQNNDSYANNSSYPTWKIGVGHSPCYTTQSFSGLISSFHFIDGLSLDYSHFARFNESGVLVPKTYTGAYGSSGYKLMFDDINQLGKDTSGNNNHFTETSLITDPADPKVSQVRDTPTLNYATLNNRYVPGFGDSYWHTVFYDGNLRAGSDADPVYHAASTTCDNIYFEMGPTVGANERNYPGLHLVDLNTIYTKQALSSSVLILNTGSMTAYRGGSTQSWTPWFQNDILRVTYQTDTRTLSLAVSDGPWQTMDLTDGQLDDDFEASLAATVYQHDGSAHVNYGQRDFAYDVPDGFQTANSQNVKVAIHKPSDYHQVIIAKGDGNDGATAGQLGGNWSSFMFSSSGTAAAPANPESTVFTPGLADSGGSGTPNMFDGNPSTMGRCGDLGTSWLIFRPETPIDISTGDFQIRCNRTQSTWINGVNCNAAHTANSDATITLDKNGATQLEYLWVCGNGDGGNAAQIQQVIVNGNVLVDFSILAQAQTTFTNGLWWIKGADSNSQHQFVNSILGDQNVMPCPNQGPELPYVSPGNQRSYAFCWKTDGPAESNSDGTITAQVSASRESGFSIITYNNAPGGGQTVGHGLNKAPEFIISFNRSRSTIPRVWHRSLKSQGNPWQDILVLNSSSPKSSQPLLSGLPNDTIINLGTDATNSGDDYVNYVWHSVPGYSKVAYYRGGLANGAGPHVYTGFRPSWVMWKSMNGNSNWAIQTIHDTFSNPRNSWLEADSQNAQQTNSFASVDFLSNGFRWVAQSGSSFNANNNDYAYIAFAEAPLHGPAPANAVW